MKQILQKITSQNNFNLLEAKPLSGGDINEVFLMKCKEGYLVVKLNDASKFPKMFIAEAKGLELLNATSTFKIPAVLGKGQIKNTSYLLLEYISSGKANPNFWQDFGKNLARLHKTTQKSFGLEHNNYIGSLPQKNDYKDSASAFYIHERLEPQFKLASDTGFQFKDLDKFYNTLSEVIPKEAPSLIHGDLWSGNFMISKNGQPVLIDPAVAFAPREMDLAMMKLFGGFPDEVFKIYNSYFALEPQWEERLSLWQLYYLLVHLNLFGAGYLSRVKTILAEYH